MRAAGQAAALAATREQLEQWDVLMGHSASLESENRRLRCADALKLQVHWLKTLAKQDAAATYASVLFGKHWIGIFCCVLHCAAHPAAMLGRRAS